MNSSISRASGPRCVRHIAQTLIAVALVLLAAWAPHAPQSATARSILLAPPGVTGLNPTSVVAGAETIIEMTGTNIGPSTIVTLTSDTGGQLEIAGFTSAPYTFMIPGNRFTNASHDITVRIGNDGESEDPPRTLDVIPGPPAVIQISASPPSATVPVLTPVNYTAVVWDNYSHPVSPTALLNWSVEPNVPGVTLTVGATPSYTATLVSSRPGNYVITARVAASPTVQASASIEYVNRGPYTVLMQPSGLQRMSITEQRVFTATLVDVAGNPMAATFSWTTSGCSTNGAEVAPPLSSSTGATGATTTFYAPVRDGDCTVNATVTAPAVAANKVVSTPIKIGKFSVLLTPPTATLAISAPLQFTALISDTDNKRIVPNVPITWFVQPGAGAITPEGLFTAGTAPDVYHNPGVRATPYKVRLNGAVVVGSKSGNAPITVVPGPISRVVITPTGTSLIRGAQQQFTASAFDAADNPVPNAVFSWSLANPAAGSLEVLNAAGTSARLTAGTTLGAFPGAVVVSSGAASASANVAVIEGAVTRIELTPPNATLGLNQTIQFSATVFDNSGNPVSVPVTWSANSLAGSISAGGLFTALGASGVYTNAVRAQIGGVFAIAAVEILPYSPTRIDVTPVSTVNMPVSTTRLFTATLIDALGRPISDPRLSVSWSSVGAGQIASSGPLTVLLRAGVTPGLFENGVVARYGTTLVQPVKVRVLQPTVTLESSVGSGALNTDGVSRAYMTVTVGSASPGGTVGAGVPVELRVSPEDGSCAVTPPGLLYTDVNGQAFASMTCLNYTLSATDIDIDVQAAIRLSPSSSINASISHRGRGRAFTLRLPVMSYPPITNNHDACSAAPLQPGVTIYQAANNTFNLYLLTAGKTSHTFSVDGYPANGELQLFRITALGCPVQASIIARAPLTPGSWRMTVGNLTVGGIYILAVKTNAPLSASVYRLKYE